MRISLAEWRWAVAVSSLILLAAMAPNLWGYLAAPPGYHYTGLAYAWEDGASYIAKIRQGMQGAWLYTL
ncbi:MAG: hypothetical protein HY259_10690, partial [Chloroflexi bacterium]|nr:hypothetical protein [Chloroflexota bacterium]